MGRSLSLTPPGWQERARELKPCACRASPVPNPKTGRSFLQGSVSVQGGLGRCCSGRGFPLVLCVTLVLLSLWCLIRSIQRVWQRPGMQVRRGDSRELPEFGSLGVCEEGAPPPGIPFP